MAVARRIFYRLGLKYRTVKQGSAALAVLGLGEMPFIVDVGSEANNDLAEKQRPMVNRAIEIKPVDNTIKPQGSKDDESQDKKPFLSIFVL